MTTADEDAREDRRVLREVLTYHPGEPDRVPRRSPSDPVWLTMLRYKRVPFLSFLRLFGKSALLG